MTNYKILFCMRLLKSVLDTFIDTFFVLYFMEVSSDNIIPLGIYHALSVSAIFIVVYLCRNYSKTQHRGRLMRIAMILDILYFLLIIILKEQVVTYAFLLGILRGLEEGFYYAVFNTIENDSIKESERVKYTGHYVAVKSIFAVVFPILFGGLIAATSFIESTLLVVVIVAVRIVLSLLFRDKKVPHSPKADLQKLHELTHKDQRFHLLFQRAFFDGLVNSSSAFSNIITIYIIRIFSDSFSLGIFTAIFSIVSGVIGIVFAKYLRKKQYPAAISITAFCSVVTLVVMLIDCNPTTIILFKFFRTVFKDLTGTINEVAMATLCHLPKIGKNYTPELYINIEKWLVRGRLLSDVLFISMAFTDNWTPVMLFFGGISIVLAIVSVRLQYAIRHPRRRTKARQLAPAWRIITKK